MTRHVLDRLPLWIEGDLDALAQVAVDHHLATCPPCRRAAEDLRISQAWLREALVPPFGAEDHADLRAGVLAHLQEPTPPLFPWRRPALLAALAAAAALLVTTPADRTGSLPEAPPDLIRPTPAPPTPAPPIPAAALRPAIARAAPPPRPGPRPAAREAPPEPARIEFQTADPNIRIIWLAQAKPLPDTTPPLPEVP